LADGLRKKEKESILENVFSLFLCGMAILLVEEKVPFALSLAGRLYFMTKGKVVYSDTQHNLEGKQDVFVKYLGVEV